MADPQLDPYPHCDVCERTILKGEQTHEYVTPQGQRIAVCVLCRPRAEASGWIPADQVGTAIQAPPSRTGPADALRKRLGRAAARARATARPRRSAGPRQANGAKPSTVEEDPGTEQAAVSPPAGGQRSEASKGTTGSRPATKRQPKRQPKRVAKREPAGEAVPRKSRPRRGPEALMRRGVQRFNGSDETRKVAGLIRSLGEPRAEVSADAGRQLALVTVAWELSWYQWEVSSDDGNGEPVREVAKGDEVSELAEEEPTWNAAVAEDGKLRLKAASTRRKSSAKSA